MHFSFRNQSQLKLYISNFKKLINIIHKNLKSPIINQFYEFVFSNINFSTLNIHKENVDNIHLNQGIIIFNYTIIIVIIFIFFQKII